MSKPMSRIAGSRRAAVAKVPDTHRPVSGSTFAPSLRGNISYQALYRARSRWTING
jgi:hypothetical protein